MSIINKKVFELLNHPHLKKQLQNADMDKAGQDTRTSSQSSMDFKADFSEETKTSQLTQTPKEEHASRKTYL